MAMQRQVEYPPVPDDYEPPRRVSPEDYSRPAEQLAGRYEYHNGLMYPRFYPPGSLWAMAGGTEAHDQITLNLLSTGATSSTPTSSCRASRSI